MRGWRLDKFGVENLRLVNLPEPALEPGCVLVAPRAISLNYRDLLIAQGLYNPKLKLPATPISDAAGVVLECGAGVTQFRPGERVVTHMVPAWQGGPYQQEYLATTLGTPGPGLAAERVVVPAGGLAPLPAHLDFAAAATLPIAALTAWSALVTDGQLRRGERVLTLGTGGVSLFVLAFGQALGAQVAITSGSDDKLARARELGAALCVNYRTTPDWEKAVLQWTGGQGVDLAVETGGPGTLDRSCRATRAGGRVALLGALTGLSGPVNTAAILMRRLRILGIMVDSYAAYRDMLAALTAHAIVPVLDRQFPFEELPAALRYMEAGRHFGKITLSLPG